MAYKWPTPDHTANAAPLIARRFVIPATLMGWLTDAVCELAREAAYKPHGDMSPAQAADTIGQYVLRGVTDMQSMVGAIMPYAGDIPPSGMLACDGGSHLKDDYPALWAYMPVALKDATTFTTPDLRGRFVFGAHGAYFPGSTGGSETHTLTEIEIPAHAHGYTSLIIDVDVESPAGFPQTSGGTPFPTITDAAGGGQPHNNMPPYVSLHWGIVW